MGIGIEVYKAECQPGADVVAVWFRLAMVTLLIMTEHQELILANDEIRVKVFSVAARIPMAWPQEGPHEATFDTEEFVREVRSLARTILT